MKNAEGFILINKEQNMTSYDVIRYFKKKGLKKIGHTGTLDPNTEGLLILAVNRATKFIPIICENSQKEYITVMKIGVKTDTGDITGKVLSTDKDLDLKEEEITSVIKSYKKTYKQIPPIFSSKKINGKKAYEYGRNEEKLDMSIRAKEVTIYDIEILDIDLEQMEVKFKALVSKGTYIRSLIEDIAEDLGTVATMKSLIRTKTDGFDISRAKKMEEINLEDVVELKRFLLKKYQSHIKVEGKVAQLVKNGVQINNENIIEKFDKISKEDNLLIIDKDTDEIIALYEKVDASYKVKFMMWR